MLLNPNNEGKYYCKKCQTFVPNAYKECPLCSTPKEKIIVEQSQNGPTEIDISLYNLIRPMNDMQKKMLISYIEDNIS